MKPIRVLIVDDSATMRALIRRTLEQDADILVVGEAGDPLEARTAIKTLEPDVITLDVEMPNMNGIEFLERLMRLHPIPVIMVSTLTQRGADATLAALERGAVDCVGKPVAGGGEGFAELCLKVRTAAGARVAPPSPVTTPARPVPYAGSTKVVVIGASTGGVEALLRLADGRYLAFAERGPTDKALRPLLIFSGDPADSRTTVTRRTYAPPPGFSPTDAAQLPDGRIVVLNRRFGFATLFTTALVTIDQSALYDKRPVAGTVIARLTPPTLHDNFEGLDVGIENGRPIIWMISDDNFMSWQSTYLLKFALDATGPAAP